MSNACVIGTRSVFEKLFQGNRVFATVNKFHSSDFGVKGSNFGVKGSDFGVKGSDFGVKGSDLVRGWWFVGEYDCSCLPTLRGFHAKAQRKQRAQKRIYRDNRINRDKNGNHESTQIDTNQDKT